MNSANDKSVTVSTSLPESVHGHMQRMVAAECRHGIKPHTVSDLIRRACMFFYGDKRQRTAAAGRLNPESPVQIAFGALDHLRSARGKHPEFATCFDFKTAAERRAALAESRDTVAECYAVGELPVTVLMQCELNEFFTACHDGDRVAAWHELLDVFALGLRVLLSDGRIGVWSKRFEVFTGRRPMLPEDDE